MPSSNPQPTAIAVDLGATNIRAGLVRRDGRILAQASIQTPQCPKDAEVIVESLGGLIHRTIPGGGMASVAGIGVSAAGPVDLVQGMVIHPPNIALPSIPLVAPLEERFQLPVHLMNDCHAGAIGERAFGAGCGVANFVYLTISTGIGAGVFEQGRLLQGEEGNFAEVGHFLVETTWNLPCGCGGRGHWEGCGSGRFIPAFFQEWCHSKGYHSPFISMPDAATLFTAAGSGDPIVSEFLAVLGRIQANGISLLIAAYDPGIILLDGSVVRNNWQHFEQFSLPHVRSVSGRMPKIRMSPLGGYAPLLGAASCVFDGTMIP
ncbi:MAG: ROK family protein [Methanolinea sp.]|jgi:glucokinase|nr:ROK family protein [Methanolinea sp.]